MKKILIVLALVVATTSVKAQTKFFEGSWREASAEAQKQDKYLFIDCYTDWCGWCKVADKKTFPNEDVGKLLNEYFIPIKLDMETNAGVRLAMKYRVTGFPSYLVFSPDGILVHKVFGYIEDPMDFVSEVKKSLDNNRSFNYPSKLTDKVEFPPFYINAFTNKDTDQKRQNPEQEEVDNWLSKQESWLSEEAWSVAYRFPLNEENTERFLKNRKELARMFGKTEMLDKTSSLASQLLDKAMKSKDKKDLEAALDFVDKYIDEDKKATLVYYRMRFSEAVEDWSSYADGAQDMIRIYGLENHLNGINNYSWTIYLKVDDSSVLKKAIGWMEKVVSLNPLYMYLDTYAALYFKIGNYNEALVWADKAIEAGKKTGEDVKETEALRDKIVAANGR